MREVSDPFDSEIAEHCSGAGIAQIQESVFVKIKDQHPVAR